MDFQKTVIKQFEKLNERFDGMDQRFDKMENLQDLVVIKLTEVSEKTDRLETVQNAMQKDLTFVKDAVEGLAMRQMGTELEVAALHSRVTRCEAKIGA
jgi:predicted  nucleic acid-binding Zn-ribbon protein